MRSLIRWGDTSCSTPVLGFKTSVSDRLNQLRSICVMFGVYDITVLSRLEFFLWPLWHLRYAWYNMSRFLWT